MEIAVDPLLEAGMYTWSNWKDWMSADHSHGHQCYPKSGLESALH